MKLLIIALITSAFLNINSCKNNPVGPKPENRNPLILSLNVFPKIVKPTDSLIVICDAMDPDADTLVYDWYTTGIVKIKGAHDCCAFYNTHQNSQIFYAPDSANVVSPLDTLWVECAARDGKGGQAVRTVLFFVTKDF